ncbi:alpha/beta hydrolase [Amycolatopsis lurida]
MQAELGGLTNGPGHDNSRYVLQGQIDDLQGKLSGLNEIQARLDTNPGLPEDRRYYLLGIDSTGDGKAIVATGNPDTAQNVATFVPGTGTDLATIGSTLDRSDVMHRAADKTGAGPNSVISWLGYDAPDSVHNAAMSGYAEDARKPLDSFQDGLRESHIGAPSRNTVIGHSYGSTAAGFAARDEQLAVDAFVAVGSPGVGVDDATGLHLPPEQVWAVAAANDPVADLQRFGNAPTDPDFGANKIDASPRYAVAGGRVQPAGAQRILGSPHPVTGCDGAGHRRAESQLGNREHAQLQAGHHRLLPGPRRLRWRR